MSRSEALRYFPLSTSIAYLIAIIINLFVLYQEGGFRESTPYLIALSVRREYIVMAALLAMNEMET